MWHTSRGDRTLRGSEATLVSLAIDTMIDALLVHLDDEDDASMAPECQSGIAVYDALAASQRIGLLHDVARYLLTETESVLPLSAATEAAIAAIYVEVRDQVAIEIDLYSENAEGDCFNDGATWRNLVLDAYQLLFREAEPGQDFYRESDACFDPSWQPEPTSDDLEHWETLIERLTDAVLWDRDFEMADSFLDVDPGVSDRRRRLLGIDADYFTYVAPDPRPEQMMRLVWDTRDIVRSKPR
ncbi:hypothetical protein Pla52o_45150 [Novipirellula galeiformis]|uniref:Uncharacterized protein n=1 Tax=Novipirellula galeiformis TaxID=2528004 RepID=A0A5C6C9P2_9BACT|nr:hypothetical protein [Novipirellula galeiformis]TWU20637.1 hypothetical protein Pla52o_45150 [Novipirellula galeiformis]